MRIFISYRRDDSRATASHMADFLDGVPTVEEVFLDVDAIPAGKYFRRSIRPKLAKATHVFILIGPLWKGPTERARIMEPADLVRREIAAALRSGAIVVPILLDGVEMPLQTELPDDIQQLSEINAFPLRTSFLVEDMDDLLDELIDGKEGRTSRWRPKKPTLLSVVLRTLAGVALGALLASAIALWIMPPPVVRPMPIVRLGISGTDELFLHNKGDGKAFLKAGSFTGAVDGEFVSGWEDFLDRLHVLREVEVGWTEHLTPGERKTILKVKGLNGGLSAKAQRMTFLYCYCDERDTCWVVSWKAGVPTTAPGRCREDSIFLRAHQHTQPPSR